MELRHLRYFVAVADQLHFGRAAETLNISGATLSNQIRALESMLSARLVNRRTKTSVSLTEAGKIFLIEARAALKQADRAELVGRRAGRGEVGSIAMGYVMSAVTSGLLQEAVEEFRTNRPDVSFQLRRAETFAQMQALTEGHLDIGIMRPLGRYPAGLGGFLLLSEPYVIALPAKHPLARRKQLTPADIIGEPLIAATLQMEVGFWDNLASVVIPDAPLNIVARAPDMLSVLALAGAGVGISAVGHCLQNMPIPGVVFRPIAGVERQSELAAVYRNDERDPLVKSFIAMLRNKSRRLP